MHLRPLLILVFGITLLGCRGNTLVGTWGSSMGGSTTTYHFRKDGTFTMDTRFEPVHLVVEGTYEVGGNYLALVPTKVDAEGPEPRASELKAQANQTSKVSMKINSPDSIMLFANDPAPLFLNRRSREP